MSVSENYDVIVVGGGNARDVRGARGAMRRAPACSCWSAPR